MARFPHLKDSGNSSDFPDVSTVEVFKYDNAFDYSRYDNAQMNIVLCKVPWDMGEAHVGNRTISGIGNVVYFGTKAKRDAWFDALDDEECYRFSTKYKELHRDNSIVVPIPFDVAARFNYIAVSYEPFASDGDLIEYESSEGLDKWFWFVREVEFLSPNSTRLHLLNDAWQTFIYDIDIPYMMLERGHAPMAATSASTYLANPIGNCENLLAPEELQPTEPRISTSTHEKVFNTGTMYAVIITSSGATSGWGSKSGDDWNVPTSHVQIQGVPSYGAFAIAASSLSSFLANVTSSYPQFSQTVQAVAFVSSDLLTLGSSFTFANTTCYNISAEYKSADVHTLAKSDFGYSSNYADIAKLYTYPYAVIIITDSNGNETLVKVEDTNGKIQLSYCLSLVFPWLQINGAITSVGKTANRSIAFSNVTTRNMPIGGNWHELLMSWDVPTFGIIEAASVVNDYATHYERAQQGTAATNAQSNANASANNIVNNASVTTAANTAVATASNTSAAGMHADTVLYNLGMKSSANSIISDNATSTIQAAEQQATVSAASGVVSSAIGAIASGNPVGAAASVASGIVGAASTIASMNIGNALTAAQADNAKASNSANAGHGNDKDNNDTTVQMTATSSIANAQNTATSSHAANDSATQIANATRDYNTAQSAISNQVKQAALNAPEVYGEFAGGEYATTRPLALFSNVLTQDDYTIKRCGDDFLRYGYSYNAQWAFDGNWCIMPKFTYWRLTDFWVEGLQIPDMYVDKIRFFLFGGVTVWSKPEYIGNTSIYDN